MVSLCRTIGELYMSHKRGYTNQLCSVDLYNLFFSFLEILNSILVFAIVKVRKFRIISMFLIDFMSFLRYNEE